MPILNRKVRTRYRGFEHDGKLRYPWAISAVGGKKQGGNNVTDFGPDNPHPLSQMRTELVWEGKYNENGNRREVDIAGCAMPMQRIETIDEPRSRAEAQGELFDTAAAHPDDFRNRLAWGDNKLARIIHAGPLFCWRV